VNDMATITCTVCKKQYTPSFALASRTNYPKCDACFAQKKMASSVLQLSKKANAEMSAFETRIGKLERKLSMLDTIIESSMNSARVEYEQLHESALSSLIKDNERLQNQIILLNNKIVKYLPKNEWNELEGIE
jgi:hypothetical protein